MGQNVTIPVYKGEIQARNLGMAVEAWDDEGKPVWGESGELVCTKPMPCQPTHFWNDENGIKYRKAYFSKFPVYLQQISLSKIIPKDAINTNGLSISSLVSFTNFLYTRSALLADLFCFSLFCGGDTHTGVWSHGDYCKINPKTGGIVMLGRSDGTLNPSGVRFGSSEIYNIVEAFEEVSDSLCVPQYSKDGEERVILFLKMATNRVFSLDLVQRMREAIRAALSARHVPSLILETEGIPYTINGKKVEVAVKQIIAGKEVEQRGTFSNPETLDLYRDIPELRGF
ncbi:UNVERIFIED_CONTAM: hypothetical protein K2H54_011292 [Gekko kuhli]